jgi:hypothetical protein
MDKVHKTVGSQCYTPSSECFRIPFVLCADKTFSMFYFFSESTAADVVYLLIKGKFLILVLQEEGPT